MGSNEEGTTVDGMTIWTARTPGAAAAELTTATSIELGADGSRWTVSRPSNPADTVAVESQSRAVQHYLHRVVQAMDRVTRRAMVRPAPKPPRKATRRLPKDAPVPCPLCGGGGEGWVDCRLCDGEGFIPQQQAAEWADRMTAPPLVDDEGTR